MKEYIKPQMELTELENEDLIITSNGTTDTCGDSNTAKC